MRSSREVTHWTWQRIFDWTYAMPQRYGNVVLDSETGKEHTWPDAIARELYGPNWCNHPDYIMALDIAKWEPAPKAVINLLERWEENPAEIEWAVYQR